MKFKKRKGEKIMKITSVNVKKIEKENSRLKGIASIVIDDSMAIHNIRIIQGDERLFVAMPSYKSKEKYFDFVHPINKETREYLDTTILKEYEGTK